MAIKLSNNQILLDKDTQILKQNRDKIYALNSNSYFSHRINNDIGKEFVLYLCNTFYHSISNPEPVDLNKNTLSKTLRRIKVIDDYINKPLNEYIFTDLNNFIRDFSDGKIEESRNKKFNPKAIGGYIRDFKRFWKIYRQYELNNNPKEFNQIFFEFGLNLKAPKVKLVYEDFKDLRIDQVIELSNNLCKEEYKVRALLSVNLMGRKCEIQNLKFKDLEFNDDKIFVKLPQIKKHSTEKTSVELFTFVKKPLIHYLEHNKFDDESLIFPSKEEAFAKNLKEVSEALFNARINPKTLRKIGVAVADELGISRSDIERIGGWEVNSPVLAHYFNRKKKVLVNNGIDNKINESLYSDVYAEFEKVKVEAKNKEKEVESLKEQMKIQEEMLKKEMNRKMKEMFKELLKKGEYKHPNFK